MRQRRRVAMLLCTVGAALSTGCLRSPLWSPLDAKEPRARAIFCNLSDRSFSVRVNGYGLLGLAAGKCVPAEVLAGTNALFPAATASSSKWFQDAAWLIEIPSEGARIVFGTVADGLRLLAAHGLASTAPATALRCHRPSDFTSVNEALEPPMVSRAGVIRWTRIKMACQ